MLRKPLITLLVGSLVACWAGTSPALTFNGTLYYTTYNGGQNVWDISFSYDDVTHNANLGAAHNLASTPGADGIIFAPSGNLLIGGQGTNAVYEVIPSTGAIVHSQAISTPSYHLALDPNNTKVYTSNFGGPLQNLMLSGGSVGSGFTTTGVTGGDAGVTQVAFGTGGTVFYVNGNPNGFGNLGTIDLSTGATTRLHTSVQPAHGLIYDPFTSLMTMFGAGETGTMSAVDGSGLLTSALIYGVSDFDQGAVDGLGHALVAGSNAITFIDYSQSHDITHPDFMKNFFGFGSIDDVAPLVGPGSNPHPVPEPSTMLLLGAGLTGLAAYRRKCKGS